MKKTTKTAAIAATFAVAMGLSSCTPPETGAFNKTDIDFEPVNEEPACVYGPAIYDPNDDYQQTEYGVPYYDDYDPDSDEPMDVYGPPPDMDYED